MDLNFLITESNFCKLVYSNLLYCTERLNNGLNLSYHVHWIICGTRVARSNESFFLFAFLFFRSRFKNQLHALDSFDLFHWRTTDDPIYIWYVESMSHSVQNNKFEYINITKIALNYKKIEVQRSVDLTCVVKRGHIEYHW